MGIRSLQDGVGHNRDLGRKLSFPIGQLLPGSASLTGLLGPALPLHHRDKLMCPAGAASPLLAKEAASLFLHHISPHILEGRDGTAISLLKSCREGGEGAVLVEQRLVLHKFAPWGPERVIIMPSKI